MVIKSENSTKICRTVKINQEDYAKLKLLEENLWKSDFRFNISEMDEILAADFFEFGRSGKVYQRSNTLNVTSQEIPAVFPLIDFQIRLIDKSTAQVTYSITVNYSEGIEKSLRSSIWSFSSNRWQLRFHQGTPLTI